VPDRVMGAIPADEMVARLRSVDRACDAHRPPPAPAGGVAMACVARW